MYYNINYKQVLAIYIIYINNIAESWVNIIIEKNRPNLIINYNIFFKS